MNGGQRFTVWLSSWMSALKAFCGSFLNQSGSPSTAGNGRASTGTSSGGQRKVSVI